MIYFISGHRDLSYEDFKKYYIPKIREVLENDPWAEFIVGDCKGANMQWIIFIIKQVENSQFTTCLNLLETFQKDMSLQLVLRRF